MKTAPSRPSADARRAQPAATRARAGPADADLEYYRAVAAAKKEQQQKKPARPATAAAAAGGHEEEVSTGDKRGITYTILRNRGLTAFKKGGNNPRVKKRAQFAKKLAKLRSMKPVYGGGEGRGGYKGELTGIKAGLIKSIKL